MRSFLLHLTKVRANPFRRPVRTLIRAPHVTQIRRESTAIAITICGIVLSLACTIAAWSSLGLLGWGMLAGLIVATAGTLLFQRRVSTTEEDLDDRSENLARAHDQLSTSQQQLDTFQQQIRQQLDEEAASLEQRARELTERLANVEQWMEYPRSVVKTSADEQAQAALTQKDQQVLQLLEDESERFFEYVRTNRYTDDGKFNAKLLRDDVLDLTRRIARIYRPDIEDPLLETSIEQIVRATGRATFHLLIALDQLPINVKDYNLSSVYGYVRQSVKAYGVYKKASPYLNFLTRGLHVGRLATGANPLVAGAWWLASELGKRGGKAAVEKLVHRQAIGLLHQFVRIVGYAVAEVYGEDFRHRDPNWIYGVELASTASQFPLSRESLGQALREVSVLDLRNEYDRVYLYRCLAEHKAPDLKLSRPANLPTDQQQEVATRLESYLAQHIHGKTAGAIEKWHADVTTRFDIHVNAGTTLEPRSLQKRVESAARTVAAFLLSFKQFEPTQLAAVISTLSFLRGLNPEERDELSKAIEKNPPTDFHTPDLDPNDDLTDELLQELGRLHATHGEFDPNIDDLLVEAGGYFRRDSATMRELLDEQYREVVAVRVSESSVKRLDGDVARAILEFQRPSEQIQAIYSKVELRTHQDAEPLANGLYLLTSDERLLVFSLAAAAAPLWEADSIHSAKMTRVRGILIDDCQLDGGRLLDDSENFKSHQSQEMPPRVTVSGTLGVAFEGYFQAMTACAAVDNAG